MRFARLVGDLCAHLVAHHTCKITQPGIQILVGCKVAVEIYLHFEASVVVGLQFLGIVFVPDPAIHPERPEVAIAAGDVHLHLRTLHRHTEVGLRNALHGDGVAE